MIHIDSDLVRLMTEDDLDTVMIWEVAQDLKPDSPEAWSGDRGGEADLLPGKFSSRGSILAPMYIPL